MDHSSVKTVKLHNKIDNLKSEIFESQKPFLNELPNLKVRLLAI